MTPEEQTIIDNPASKQAAIKATINKKPQARYRISVVATFIDDAGQDPAELKEYAEQYLLQCGLDVLKCDIAETQAQVLWRPYTTDEAYDVVGRLVARRGQKEGRIIISMHDYDGEPVFYLGGISEFVTARDLQEGYRFCDGTPCGVRE